MKKLLWLILLFTLSSYTGKYEPEIEYYTFIDRNNVTIHMSKDINPFKEAEIKYQIANIQIHSYIMTLKEVKTSLNKHRNPITRCNCGHPLDYIGNWNYHCEKCNNTIEIKEPVR
jgi:hypothetical protein